MNKIIIVMLLFLCIGAYAQNQRFSYDYKFVSDSTAKDKSEAELMYLDVSKKGSKFYNPDKVQYVVEKSYPDYKIYFFNRLDMDEYKISDNRKLDWKILSDKEKIGEFNAQKATVKFAGRQWTAWFTTDIPFQDGPYKFSGLPGLIVKIEDKTNSHSFILKEVKNLKPDEVWISENDKKRFDPLIILNQDKYKKQFIDSRNNPTKGMRQFMSRGGSVTFTVNGKEVDANKMLHDQEKKQRKIM